MTTATKLIDASVLGAAVGIIAITAVVALRGERLPLINFRRTVDPKSIVCAEIPVGLRPKTRSDGPDFIIEEQFEFRCVTVGDIRALAAEKGFATGRAEE